MMLLVHSVYTTAFCDLLSFSCRSVRKLDFWVSFQTRQIMTLWDCEMGRAAIPELFDKFVEWDNWCDRMFQNIFTLISLCRAVSVSHFFFFFFFFFFSCLASLLANNVTTHSLFSICCSRTDFVLAPSVDPFVFSPIPAVAIMCRTHHCLALAELLQPSAPGLLSSVSCAPLVGKFTDKRAAIRWQARELDYTIVCYLKKNKPCYFTPSFLSVILYGGLVTDVAQWSKLGFSGILSSSRKHKNCTDQS